MKKILVLIAILLATGLVAVDRYTIAATTIGDIETVATLDTIAYASTNELAFTLDSGLAYYEIPAQYYSSYVVTVQVTYRGNPANVNLTIGTASCGHELTAANAISQLDSDFWATKVIDLNTVGGTGTEYYLLPDCLLNGKYIYFKYQYSGDCTTDPKIAIFINKI